jgi:hypothetical protein
VFPLPFHLSIVKRDTVGRTNVWFLFSPSLTPVFLFKKYQPDTQLCVCVCVCVCERSVYPLFGVPYVRIDSIPSYRRSLAPHAHGDTFFE